jgi:hypothetical protein
MPALIRKNRPANPNINTINNATDDDIDRLLLWGATHYGKRLPNMKRWAAQGMPTGIYQSFKPSYKFVPLWREDDHLGSDAAIVMKAMARCFGSRQSDGWTIWIQGTELVKIFKQFRTEYIALEDKKDPALRLLDDWARDILAELFNM